MAQKQTPQSQRGRDWAKDYDESDMKVLFNRGQWRSWDDAIGWLQRRGMNDNELTPGEVNHMKEDIGCLSKDRVRFTDDYRQAYRLARQHCAHGR